MAGTIKADIIQSELSTPTVFRNSSNTEIGRLSRVQLNYNGAGSVVNASFNVSSVTKNGTGDYTSNFTNTFSDANYSAIATGSSSVASTTARVYAASSSTVQHVITYVNFPGSNLPTLDAGLVLSVFR